MEKGTSGEHFKGRKMGSFIRHSTAKYGPYARILRGEANIPGQLRFDADSQFSREAEVGEVELTQQGQELARTSAEAYFDQLLQETGGQAAVVFLSSNEQRALETAQVYLDVAKAKGVEVVKLGAGASPGKRLAEDLAGGDIRVLRSLSLNSENILMESVFTQGRQMKPDSISWDAVPDPKFRQAWEAARAIVAADERGSFGANFAAHSDQVRQVFADNGYAGLETAQKLFADFKERVLERLKHFASLAERAPGKQLRLLLFGHENYWMYAIQQLLGEDGLKNCEEVGIFLDADGKIRLKFRGKEAVLE